MNEQPTVNPKNQRAVRKVTREVLLDKYGTPTLRDRLSNLRPGRRRPVEPEQQTEQQDGQQTPPSQRQQGSPQWWAMKTASKVVRVPYTLPLVALAAWALWKADRRTDAAYLLGVLGVAQAIDGLLKKTVDERRPEQGGAGKEPNSSFPSDHGVYTSTLAAAAVFLSWSSPYRLLAVLLGPGLSLLSGVSRLYFRRHHPRDVLVGWAIGVLVAVVGRAGHDRLTTGRERN